MQMDSFGQLAFAAIGALVMLLGGLTLAAALRRSRASDSTAPRVVHKTRIYFVLGAAVVAIVLLVVAGSQFR